MAWADYLGKNPTEMYQMNVPSTVNATTNSAKSDFDDPYNFTANVNNGWRLPDWLNEFTKIFGYDDQQRINAQIAQDNRNYERAAIQSARAYEEYYAKNIAKWTAQGLKDAGLNPWLAVQGGSFNTSTSNSAASANASGMTKVSNDSLTKKANDTISTAMKLIMMLALLG